MGGITFRLKFVNADHPTAQFKQAVETAASALSSAIHDKITLNIVVDYAGTGDAFTPQSPFQNVAYSTVANYLIGINAPGASSLPSGTSINGQSSIRVYEAQLKAMGLVNPNDTSTFDGSITIATDFPAADLVAISLHELTEAMGRTVGDRTTSYQNIFDFYGGTGVFTLDGGKTVLAKYGIVSDRSDFDNAYSYLFDLTSDLTPEDPFDQAVDPNTQQSLTSVDLLQMGALGFDTGPANPDVVTETAPTFVGTNLGQEFDFTGASAVRVVDAGARADQMTTTVRTSNGGDIAASGAGGATVTGTGTTSLTIIGTLGQVNAALATLAYTNTNAGNDTVTVATTDAKNNSSASAAINVTQFDTRPYAFTVTGSSFSYTASSNKMTGSGSVNIALAAAPTTQLVTAQSATASYDTSKFNASGTFYENVTGRNFALFRGSLALSYSGGTTTTSVTDSGAFAGKFDLGGLNVTFNQLTFQTGAVLAGFSVALTFPGTAVSIPITVPAGINSGISFSSSGASLTFGGSVNLPNVAPVNVFGMFTGSLTNASLSWLAASDTLQLQGSFTASQILGTSLQATVNFSGSNYIQYQNGTPYFNGSLAITGLSGSQAGFGINEIDLTVNTKAQSFSGAVAFTMPFGASVTKDKVTASGNWVNGPVINSVGVSFSGLAIPVPLEPALVWTSASVQVTNMFTPKSPTTFSGTLGFGFGPQLAGNYVGSLTLQGSGSSDKLTGSASIQLVPYSFVNNIAGGTLSGLQSIFPLLSSTDQVTVNFSNSKFDNFAFTGTTSILGNFITTSQSFTADANLDFTIAGSAAVNFGNAAFSKLINVGALGVSATANANYLVSYSANAALSADYAAAWGNATVSWGLLSANVTFEAKVDFAGNASLRYSAATAIGGGAAAGIPAAPDAPSFVQSAISPAQPTCS